MRFKSILSLILVLIISPTNTFGIGNFLLPSNDLRTNYIRFDQQKFMNTKKFSNTLIINGNRDLQQQAQLNGWEGSGTKTNPITIEGYTFPDADSTTSASISINNVNLFFLIKSNDFALTNSSTNYSKDNIVILNSSNGMILQNSFYNPFVLDDESNIYISNSQNITIKENIFESVYQYSVQLLIVSSSQIKITENTFLEDQFNNLLIVNYCNNSAITNNIMNNGTLVFYFDYNINITNNILNNAFLEVSISNLLINYNIIENIKSYPGIILNTGFTPKPYEPINTYYHINNFLLYYGTIIENNLLQNNFLGIEIYRPVDNQIFITCPGLPECTDLPSNYSGISILHYSNILIRHNAFVNNTWKAITIGDYNDNNTIYENNFINNNQSLNTLNSNIQFTTQVYEFQPQNVSNNWFFKGKGNYWSDYNFHSNTSSIGLYPIQINANNSDPYPLLEPVTIIYTLSIKPGAHWTNLTSQNLQEYVFNTVFPVFLITVVVVLTIVFLDLSVQYSKYRKLKKQKNANYNNFSSFLITNLPFKSKKTNHLTNKLSDRTLEMIDEIMIENKET